jgi:hypothetical protein
VFSSIVGVFTNNVVHLDALLTSPGFGGPEGVNLFCCRNKSINMLRQH